MSAKKAWILYTLLRLLFFVVPFTIVMLLLPYEYRFSLNWGTFFAAISSAVIALALSVLFLGKLRARAAAGIAEWRTSSHTSDNEAEDEIIGSTEEVTTAEQQSAHEQHNTTAQQATAEQHSTPEQQAN